jgi:hypothetical protein
MAKTTSTPDDFLTTDEAFGPIEPLVNGALVTEADAAQTFMRRIAKNLGADAGAGITLFPTIRIPGSGGKFWAITNEEGEEQAVPTIEGVLAYWHPSRAYGVVPYNQRSADDSKSPDCRSSDAKQGVGNPGVACKTCPFAAWGSAPNGIGAACGQMRNLYLLRDGMYLPDRLVLPVTSIKPFTQFMKTVVGLNKDYDEVRVKIGLEVDESAGGIPYAKATFKPAGFADAERVGMARQFGMAIQILVNDPQALDEFVA